MTHSNKAFSIVLRILGAVASAAIVYIALSGTFGLGKAARCLLLLLPTLGLCGEPLSLLWRHWRKGEPMEWNSRILGGLLYPLIAFAAICLGIFFWG